MQLPKKKFRRESLQLSKNIYIGRFGYYVKIYTCRIHIVPRPSDDGKD